MPSGSPARTLLGFALLLALTACHAQTSGPDATGADTSIDTTRRDAADDRRPTDATRRDGFDGHADGSTDADASGMATGDAEETEPPGDTTTTADATDTGVPDADAGGTPMGPWTRLIGTGGTASINDIAVSANGAVYVCGSTDVPLGNQSYAGGSSDAWLAKYDRAGNRRWVRLLGSSFIDVATSVTLGGGEVFVAGSAGGSIGGQRFRGGRADGFLALYDGRGDRQWTRLVGTLGDDGLAAVAIDASENVFAVGQSGGSLAGQIQTGGPTDGLLTRFDRRGNRQWVRLLGSRSGDSLSSVAIAGPDRIVAAGTAGGPLADRTFNGGGSDSLVTEYNKQGKRIWTRLPGTSEADSAFDVAVDANGGRYVTGESAGPMSGTGKDYFLGKFDAAGARTWLRRSRMDGPGAEGGRGLAIDPAGDILLVGWTDHAFGGATGLQGPTDALVATYDPRGMRTRVRLVGGPAEQFAEAAALDGPTLYLGGLTTGGFDGATFGGGNGDGFVAKRP